MKKVAFIVPYPIGFAPSQRFRFEQYTSFLEENNFQLEYFPFLSENDFKVLYESGQFFRKFLAIIKGFLKRFIMLFQLGKFDIIFIHREASPIGPPIFEWFISKLLKKKIIYDFDDAIWLKNTSETNRVVSSVKGHSKVGKICKWSNQIFCGNDFLMSYAKQFNKNVVYIPTTIDTENTHNQVKKHSFGNVNIGWTGTHSTIKYLEKIELLLARVQKKINFDFTIISDVDPNFKSLNYSFLKWNKKTELSDLLTIDIGLMPLEDTKWTRGKCGFKALQYMALGIPCIISPVGVNKIIVKDNYNGYLADSEKEWENKIKTLANDFNLRTKIGTRGVESIKKNYSVIAFKNSYINFFEELID